MSKDVFSSIIAAGMLASMGNLIRVENTISDEERAARRKARNDAYLAELRAQEERDRPIVEAAAAKRARKAAKRLAAKEPT